MRGRGRKADRPLMVIDENELSGVASVRSGGRVAQTTIEKQGELYSALIHRKQYPEYQSEYIYFKYLTQNE